MEVAARSLLIRLQRVSVILSSSCYNRSFATSTACLAGAKWRLQQNLGKCGNEYGPLVDIPDWSFADGRPAPIAPKEKVRREKQKILAEKAVSLINELKDAKRLYAEKKTSGNLQELSNKTEFVFIPKKKVKPRVERVSKKMKY